MAACTQEEIAQLLQGTTEQLRERTRRHQDALARLLGQLPANEVHEALRLLVTYGALCTAEGASRFRDKLREEGL